MRVALVALCAWGCAGTASPDSSADGSAAADAGTAGDGSASVEGGAANDGGTPLDAVAPDGGGTNGVLVFVGDFEAPGQFSSGTTYSQFSPNVDTCEHDQTCTTDSLEIVDSPVRRGSHSVRMFLKSTDTQQTSGTRAELQTGSHYDHGLDEDFWYGWSIFVPDDWTFDPADMKVVHQWHTGGSNPGPSPIIGLRIRGTRWQITRELVDGVASTKLWEEDVVRGVWTDWVMHVRWSTGASGVFTTWRNGVQVYTETGQNLATGTTTGEHYQKFGLYGTFGGSVTERTLYYDELRVAKGPDAYGLVAP